MDERKREREKKGGGDDRTTESLRKGVLQLRIHKPATMTPLANSFDERLDATQEIAGVARGCVSPTAAAAALRLALIALRVGGRDVDARELGADDRGAGAMLRRGVRVPDGAHEHGSPGPIAGESPLERRAGFRKSRRVRVVVERAQVRYHVFPAAVVVHGPCWIERSAIQPRWLAENISGYETRHR